MKRERGGGEGKRETLRDSTKFRSTGFDLWPGDLVAGGQCTKFRTIELVLGQGYNYMQGSVTFQGRHGVGEGHCEILFCLLYATFFQGEVLQSLVLVL